MSRSVNKVILIGNVGRDPDIQTTASGAKVAHLSLPPAGASRGKKHSKSEQNGTA